MKFHKPLFSTIVIIVLIFSLKSYYELQEWIKANPELDGITKKMIHFDTLFLFVLIIGIYEMLTKPSLFKKYHSSAIIPIVDFKF